MKAKMLHRGLLTGHLVTMLLLPVGAVVAQNRIDPEFARCAVSPARKVGDRDVAPVRFVLKGATAPWSCRTFVEWRRDPMRRVEPPDAAPSIDVPAPTQLETPAETVPGIVQNLRRADK